MLMDFVLIGAALIAALLGGVFLTFSDFVMRGLASAAPSAGADVMQQVNRVVYRSVFMALFLGSVPLALGLGAAGGLLLEPAAGRWVLVGAVSYLLGVFAVTAAGNVPMNQRLDRLDALSGEGQRYWRYYAVRWTRLNHLRAVFSVVAAGGYLAAALA